MVEVDSYRGTGTSLVTDGEPKDSVVLDPSIVTAVLDVGAGHESIA